MGDEATPEAIADLSVDLLLDPSRILALKEKLTELVPANLGEPGGVRRAAVKLLDLIGNGPTPSRSSPPLPKKEG